MWGKLTYLADRRSSDGSYQHWGFERAHGAAIAQDAFTQVHHALIETILRTRLQLLREDLAQASGVNGTSPAFYASKLMSGLPRLLPVGCPKVSELHLVSILKTLSMLEARPRSDSRSSSQLPRLGRLLRPPADV